MSTRREFVQWAGATLGCSWLAGAEIPERSAQRIFAAADKILKAGYEHQKGGAQ